MNLKAFNNLILFQAGWGMEPGIGSAHNRNSQKTKRNYFPLKG